MTNVARAFRRDPNICGQVDRIMLTGGSINGIGNITAAAEFNCFFDPHSAQEVFSSRTTRTLVPLDVTTQVRFDLGFMDTLPERYSRVGDFLRQILPFAYRAYRNRLGQEHIYLNDAVGMLALLEPELFEFQSMAGQVETEGHLTRGVTVFDRRSVPEWRGNMEVAVSVRADEVIPGIVQRLVAAGNMV
jgi:purine nucleosidase